MWLNVSTCLYNSTKGKINYTQKHQKLAAVDRFACSKELSLKLYGIAWGVMKNWNLKLLNNWSQNKNETVHLKIHPKQCCWWIWCIIRTGKNQKNSSTVRVVSVPWTALHTKTTTTTQQPDPKADLLICICLHLIWVCTYCLYYHWFADWTTDTSQRQPSVTCGTYKDHLDPRQYDP